MKTQLHKTQQGFIVTSGEDIKKGDSVFDVIERNTRTVESSEYALQMNMVKSGESSGHPRFKVIAQQHQLDFSAISDEKCKEIGYFDWKKYCDLADGKYGTNAHSYYLGFKKMQELLSDRVFTLEDVANYLSYVEDNYHYHSDTWHDINTDEPVKRATMLFNFKKSLTPTTWEIIGEWIGDKYRITEIK